MPAGGPARRDGWAGWARHASVPPPATTSPECASTWSMKPYSLRLGGGEPAVAVVVLGDLLHRLAGLLGRQLGERLLHVVDQLGLDPDVGDRAAEAARGLVHHHPRVRGGVALALGAGGEQELPHRGRQAHRHGGDVGLDVLHRVVDRHAGGDRAARAVDVQPDVLVRVLRRQQQHLRADGVGVVVADLGPEPDDPLAQEPLVDVVVEPEGLAAAARRDLGTRLLEVAHLCRSVRPRHVDGGRASPGESCGDRLPSAVIDPNAAGHRRHTPRPGPGVRCRRTVGSRVGGWSGAYLSSGLVVELDLTGGDPRWTRRRPAPSSWPSASSWVWP